MVDPISVGMIKEYTLENDKKDPTIWLIGPLDSIMKARIVASYGSVEREGDKTVYKRNKDKPVELNNFDIVRYGLKGFKNFPLNGKEVAFKAKKEKVFNVEMDVVTDETLKVIPLYAINELASVIWGENQVGEDLEKN